MIATRRRPSAVNQELAATARAGTPGTAPIKAMRPCITHCNFMSAEAIERMQALGIVADLQPDWLWLDGKTLLAQFGEERLHRALRVAREERRPLGAAAYGELERFMAGKTLADDVTFLGIRWTDRG